jgi:Tfp pilus assembly protein PilV
MNKLSHTLFRSLFLIPPRKLYQSAAEGFSLVETLIAMFIMTFGLLAAGQIMYVAMSRSSLARSKGNAALVAQNKLELLGDLFRQNPLAADLANGNHGPEQVRILNPSTSSATDHFNVTWNVNTVADPRAGKILKAKQVRVTVTPTGGGAPNSQVGMNKVVSVTSILSSKPL